MARLEYSFVGTVVGTVCEEKPQAEELFVSLDEAQRFENWCEKHKGLQRPFGKSARQLYDEWQETEHQRFQDIAFEKGVSKEDDWIVRLHTMHYNGD